MRENVEWFLGLLLAITLFAASTFALYGIFKLAGWTANPDAGTLLGVLSIPWFTLLLFITGRVMEMISRRNRKPVL